MSKKILRMALKIIGWTAAAVFAFYFFGLLIFGISRQYTDGTRSAWSGLNALWRSDKEFGIFGRQRMKSALAGTDGPYVAGDSVYRIIRSGTLTVEGLDRRDSLMVYVDNGDQDSFSVMLRDRYPPDSTVCDMPEKLIALSDIEGNFNALAALLTANGVIDSSFNWTFGEGHLLLNGDFVDRGEEVTQVLWLIYRLEAQAREQGGQVHYLLGNHELMNFQGKWKYNKEKYIEAARLISGQDDWDKAIRFMYSDKTELGKWLRSRQIVKQIGQYLFVHAGLSPGILTYRLPADDINSIMRRHWDEDLYHHPGDNDTAAFLLGREGPVWYRGLAMDYKYYDRISEPALDSVLAFYHVRKMVIGHTMEPDITAYFGGKVINLDVRHGQVKNSGEAKGLLIENGIEYRVDDKGNRTKL